VESVHTGYYSLVLPRRCGRLAQAGLSSGKNFEKDRESARVYHDRSRLETGNEQY